MQLASPRFEQPHQDDYCSTAVPALLAKGSYKSPVSFLSTASEDDLTRCNGVPIKFALTRRIRAATISFYGAKIEYVLTPYDQEGRPIKRAFTVEVEEGKSVVGTIGPTSASRATSNYADSHSVRVAMNEARIAAFEFGQKAALTMIVAIELEY